MKTNLIPVYREPLEGRKAEEILRNCVHCGFCNATCPTYQELNDERDGPRGRIYLIKQMLEGGEVTQKTRRHLDRCLTCRSCETTCPSGVQYSRLLDFGRTTIEKIVSRPISERLLRWSLRKVLPHKSLFKYLLKVGQVLRPVLPPKLKAKIPNNHRVKSSRPKNQHPRIMLMLAGCVQASATPNTNLAAARVLDRLGITAMEKPKAGCCGAVSYHLGAHEEGLKYMKRNINAWWPAIEAGAEAIIMTASGCGAMVKEYGDVLANDQQYAAKAKKISILAKDLSVILKDEDLSKLKANLNNERIAVHCPCTLQHAMKQGSAVERVLKQVGVDLTQTNDKHLCCGSAGTYSILQPDISQKLLKKKLLTRFEYISSKRHT